MILNMNLNFFIVLKLIFGCFFLLGIGLLRMLMLLFLMYVYIFLESNLFILLVIIDLLYIFFIKFMGIIFGWNFGI